jgi:1-deoxy-D-xylulose-5-phosphate synthase
MYTAQLGLKSPIAIRYPRGRGVIQNWQLPFKQVEIGKGIQLKKGSKVAILSTGTIGNNVIDALSKIKNADLFSHYHFPFVKPLDEVLLKAIFMKYDQVITVEENSIIGGFGSVVNQFFCNNRYVILIKNLGIPDNFIEQGSVLELHKICGIDEMSLIQLFDSIV